MAHHNLKVLTPYFEAVMAEEKTFEIRNNHDRGFQKGDTVTLMEWGEMRGYTGRAIERDITYVTNYSQVPGWVVFAHRAR